MQWHNLRGYLYVPFIEQIYSVKNKYIELVNKVNGYASENYKKELSSLRHSIKKRITHIDEFIENNFDKPYTMHFEKGKCLLLQLLSYTPYNNSKNNGTNFIDIVITNENKQTKVNHSKEDEMIPVYNNFSFENAKKIKAKITHTTKSHNKKKVTSYTHNNNNNNNNGNTNKDNVNTNINNNIHTMLSPEISKQKLNNDDNVPITIKQIPKPNLQSNTHSNINKKNVSYKSNSFSLSSTISNNNDSKGKVMKLNFDNVAHKPKQNIHKAYNKFISYKLFKFKSSPTQQNTLTITPMSNKLIFNDSLNDDMIYNSYVNEHHNTPQLNTNTKQHSHIKEIIVKIILRETEYEHLLSKKAENAFSYSSSDFSKLNQHEPLQISNETSNNNDTDEDKVNQRYNNSNESSLSYNSNF